MRTRANPDMHTPPRRAYLRPFVVFFLLLSILLGGGSILQVLQWKKEMREAAHPAQVRPEAPAREGKIDTNDPMSRYVEGEKRRIRDDWGKVTGPSPSSPENPRRRPSAPQPRPPASSH